MAKNQKYGDISNLIKGVRGSGQDDLDEKETPEDKTDETPALQSPSTNNQAASNLGNRTIKKTVEINLVYDVAIENLKSDRKKKNRLQPINLPLTNNGIMDEILGEFFARIENQKYIEQAMAELQTE